MSVPTLACVLAADSEGVFVGGSLRVSYDYLGVSQVNIGTLDLLRRHHPGPARSGNYLEVGKWLNGSGP